MANISWKNRDGQQSWDDESARRIFPFHVIQRLKRSFRVALMNWTQQMFLYATSKNNRLVPSTIRTPAPTLCGPPTWTSSASLPTGFRRSVGGWRKTWTKRPRLTATQMDAVSIDWSSRKFNCSLERQNRKKRIFSLFFAEKLFNVVYQNWKEYRMIVNYRNRDNTRVV